MNRNTKLGQVYHKRQERNKSEREGDKRSRNEQRKKKEGMVN